MKDYHLKIVLSSGQNRCTPESQAAYTPESQVKLYAGVTGKKGR